MTVREAIVRALALLEPRDRRLLLVAIGIQIATSALDLVGVLLLGLMAALSVTVIQSQPPPAVVERLAGLLGVSDASSTSLVLWFAAAAAIVLLVKSIVTTILTRRILVFLANRQALLSARLTAELLSKPLAFIQRRSSQETAYALIQGVASATNSVLGGLVVAITEIALFIVLSLALVIVDPLIALLSFVYFAILAFVLQKALGGWASRIGRVSASAEIASLNSVQEALAVYREITVLDRRQMYVERFQVLRWQAASVAADQALINLIPKYLFETAMVIGGVALAGAMFATQDAVTAVGTLAVFLAAASRIMPALLRLQVAALNLRGGAGGAEPTFQLAHELDEYGLGVSSTNEVAEMVRERIAAGHGDFSGEVVLSDVTVTYPGAVAPALRGISMHVSAGKSVALIGRSGAGKTTLADVILGVVLPDKGKAKVAGLSPDLSVRQYPGALAYVPQNVAIVAGSVRDNVALGLPREAIDDDLVWLALERAHLAHMLRDQRDGLDTVVGEGGARMSGGQRQRLGIARALYTRPRVLVLDEATSALDAETEEAISTTVLQMSGDVTRIIVAHRLSTVIDADEVVYLQDGEIIARGPFEEVRARVPALDRQAFLLGLR